MLYSRFHKSKFFCATCHDVSNPAFINLPFDSTVPNDGTTVLPSESQSAYAFGHVERTFSEFFLGYGLQGGSAGLGPYAPAAFDTSKPGDVIATCQDCHMPDVSGKACNKIHGVVRPSGSVEHPNSGQPLHDLTGGNMWVPYLLASTVPSSPNFDSTNATLLGQGRAVLTLDLSQGMALDEVALLDAAASKTRSSTRRRLRTHDRSDADGVDTVRATRAHMCAYALSAQRACSREARRSRYRASARRGSRRWSASITGRSQ